MTGTAIALPTEALAAMQLAKELSKSKLVPSHFQNSPADIFLVMATTSRLGLDFFLTIGECQIIKGRLFFSGKLSAAIINSSGHLADRLSFEYSGEGPTRKVKVSARLQSEAEARTVEVELAKVKTEAAVWTSQPDQQLAYSGSRIWGRRHTPEILLGMLFEGETIDVTPTSVLVRDAPPVSLEPAQPERSAAVEPPQAQAETVSEQAQPFTIGCDGSDWRTWATLLLAYVRAAPDVDTMNEWCVRNADELERLKADAPDKHKRLVELINHQIAQRQEQANG
jgi:hypothetical protein